MRFAFGITQFTLLLFSLAATAATCGDDKPYAVSYGTEIPKASVQRYNSLDTEAANYAAREPKEQPLGAHCPTQTQNRTPEVVPNKNVQKRSDSSTPAVQIMGTWRQVVGGIAVAVLVAVV